MLSKVHAKQESSKAYVNVVIDNCISWFKKWWWQLGCAQTTKSFEVGCGTERVGVVQRHLVTCIVTMVRRGASDGRVCEVVIVSLWIVVYGVIWGNVNEWCSRLSRAIVLQWGCTILVIMVLKTVALGTVVSTGSCKVKGMFECIEMEWLQMFVWAITFHHLGVIGMVVFQALRGERNTVMQDALEDDLVGYGIQW
ncbi:hypothetical protein BDN71DRAFT_1499162 [Pleurotus eryngii]|uniref:Transmembrane protein n=1 Tax=Pleurotus eryngii TaxID=5323 RepID=A0A9P6DA05_PLEER|nr:hypothetical protein BDN71DRAFT_1499162 [Pleurotus eryngii]